MASPRKNRRAAARRAGRKQASRKQASTERAPETRTERAPVAAADRPAAGEAPAEAMSIARRVAWWALLAMVFVVPLATSNLTFLGFRLEFTYDQYDIVKVFFLRVLGLVALGACAWDLLRRGGKLRHTPVDWLIVAFLAWVAITTVTSIHWPTSLFGKSQRYEGLLSFVNYAVIYFLVLQFADRPARVRTLARSLFWSSVIVAGYGILQVAGLDPIKWEGLSFEAGRAFSTYGNPDFLGGFLIFSVAVALALALAERQLVWRLVYWTGFGINGVALVVSFTRGAWIGAALSLMLLGVVAWRSSARMRRVDWVPAAVAAALGAGIIWRSLSSASEVTNAGKRLASIFEFGSGSGKTRTEIWRAAFAAIKERPLLGWGADTFRLVSPRFMPAEYVRDAGSNSIVDNAHDYPLQLAVSVGIPGMLMMYAIFVWAGVRSFATVFRRSDDPGRIVLGAFWAAAAGYLVQLLVGLSVTGTSFLLWAALGAVLAPTARVVEVKAARWGTVAGAIVVVLAALGICYQVLPLAADHAFLIARKDSVGPARTQAARRAVRLDPFSSVYRSEVGIADMNEVQGYAAAVREAQQAGQDPAAYKDALGASFVSGETALKDAVAYTPDDYDNFVYLANLYNLGGDEIDSRYYDQAINAARDGLRLNPYGIGAGVLMARALLSQGKTAAGIEELKHCLQIDPSDGDAALMLAQAYENSGRPAEALAVLEAVEALVPGQPGVEEAIQRLKSQPTPSPAP